MANTIEYSFIVDTYQYAGNFERPLCAFMTGHIGDCEVGQEESSVYSESYEWLDYIDHRLNPNDTVPTFRPCRIYPTTGWGNNGRGKTAPIEDEQDKINYPYPAYNSVEIYLKREPTAQEIAFLKERALAFNKYLDNSDSFMNHISIRSFALLKREIIESIHII